MGFVYSLRDTLPHGRVSLIFQFCSGFMVGNFTTAILYLTVTCYKLLLAGFLKSPIFHNLL